MIQLELTPEEREILLHLLEQCIADLHSEITHTDHYEYREMLKSRKATLQKLLTAVQQSEQGVPTN
jgi:hypothetical protein